MNQRIKDIFEQACFETKYDDGQNLRETMDRFAELIVRECAQFIFVLDAEPMSHKSAARLLQEHFGVE